MSKEEKTLTDFNILDNIIEHMEKANFIYDEIPNSEYLHNNAKKHPFTLPGRLGKLRKA